MPHTPFHLPEIRVHPAHKAMAEKAVAHHIKRKAAPKSLKGVANLPTHLVEVIEAHTPHLKKKKALLKADRREDVSSSDEEEPMNKVEASLRHKKMGKHGRYMG